MTDRIAAPWKRTPAALAGALLSAALMAASAAPLSQQTIEDRIRPVGQVRIAGQVADEEPVAQAPAAERTGKEVVDAACAACHSTGAAGAPKTGDKAQWDPRVAQGFDTLASHAINGFKGMPARGGNPSLTDLEVKRGVAHLLEQVGVKVDVPAPAPPAAAAPAPASAAAGTAASSPSPASAVAPAPGGEAAGPAANLERGETIYKQACAACHAMGVVGAPKTGDRDAWAARIQQGTATLNQHALQGIRGMPPKGGRVDLPDEVVTDAVAYMVKESS